MTVRELAESVVAHPTGMTGMERRLADAVLRLADSNAMLIRRVNRCDLYGAADSAREAVRYGEALLADLGFTAAEGS